MDAKVLTRYLDRLIDHASRDVARPHICGALVEANGLTVATDGHRMLVLDGCPIDRFGAAGAEGIFLPGAWLRLAREALAGVDGQVQCEMRHRVDAVGTQATARVELWTGDAGTCVSASAEIRAKFPPWRQVVPAAERPEGLRANVSRRALAALVKKTSRDLPARLTLNDGGLYVTINGEENDPRECVGSTPLLDDRGKPIDAGAKPLGGAERVVCLQAGYLLDAIRAGDSVVRVDIAEPLDPVVFSGEGWRSVVMPRRD